MVLCGRQLEREFEEGGFEDADADLIGPAPPELAAELEGAGDDARAQEVLRVLRRACMHAPPRQALPIPAHPLQ